MVRSSLLLAASLLSPPAVLAADAGLEHFEKKVRPVLVEHCYSCHGAEKQKGGLRLDSRAAVLRGGGAGPALVAGKPAESLLIQAVRYMKDELQMPPKQRLSAEQVADLERWVEMGAPDPRQENAGANVDADWDAVLRERRKWWSLQPVRKPAVPFVASPEPANDVDHFILAKLAANDLHFAPVADRTVLARRLSFVLTGLPPTAEQIAACESGDYEGYVDSLLTSPHFGERFARHWMDVVRYGDTYGYEWDIPAKGAWRYRDYLIRAFNGDVPFNRLVHEQIAGDLIDPRVNADGINESRIGPMFFQLGEKRHGDSAMFNGIHQEMLDNKIDAFSKAFQAMTVACARCHDHKLDAVAQRDYYALAGVFMSGRWVANTIDSPDRNRETMAKLRDLKGGLRKEIAAWWLEAISAKDWNPTASDLKDAGALEHPLRPWKLVSEEKDVPAAWAKVKETYAKESADRAAANARDFRVVADFTKEIPAGWSLDGVGLRDGLVRTGDFTVSLEGPGVLGRVLPGGLYTDELSPRLNGTVRSPFLRDFGRKNVSVLVAGNEFAAERVVVDNAFLAERQKYLTNAEPAWRTSSTFPEQKDRRTYLEYATKASNPNFPPRWGLGTKLTPAQEADPRSRLGVVRVVEHDVPGSPADELKRFGSFFAAGTPRTREEAIARYADWLRAAVQAWAADNADEEHVRLLNWMLRHGLLPNSDPPAKIASMLAEYRRVEATLLVPQAVNGLNDADPGEDYRLNLRGDFDVPGSSVPRGYLGVFPPLSVGAGSGRRELAEAVASSANPLTARVYVNRVWQWVFGAGLVATPDDFGKLGEAPSHPELLDYLASWFVENGWSMKKLVRLLVMSRTFRQSGAASAKALQVDGRNRLLHHYALRRLEAEAIRDSILAASGRLNRTLFGPPVNPYRTNEDELKRLFCGPLDGDGRRSIYTKVTIMEPPKFLAVFNQPPPKIPTGRRDVTNVPAQALALLNDPFVTGQAEVWGKSLAASKDATIAARLDVMFRKALSRPPSVEETKRWAALVAGFAKDHDVAASEILKSPEVWKDTAHALFNTKEFIYIR